MTPEDMPRTADGLEFRSAGDETLVHDPVSAKVHVLNATAGEVLRACDGATTLATIGERIARERGARTLDVTNDVVAICEQFLTLGLVR